MSVRIRIALAGLAVCVACAAPAAARAEEHGSGHEVAGHHEGHDISQIKWLPAVGRAAKEAPRAPAFVWMVVNFLVLVGLLYYASRGTVKRFLADRRNRLMANIDEAARMKQEAEARHEEYSGKLDRMEEEEEEIREDLLTAALKDKDRLVADAGARAEKMRTEAVRLVERERAEAEFRLRREAAGRAVEVAREILAARIGPGEHRRLVDDYMRMLEGQVEP
jgi:F-type H+-transporting ATPase subunit b